eukprot:g8803.t1
MHLHYHHHGLCMKMKMGMCTNYNRGTNDVQWNHPLAREYDDNLKQRQEEETTPPPSPTKKSVGKSLMLYHSKLRAAAEHVVQTLLKDEVEYEHKINLEMMEYIASLREELKELQGHKRSTGIDEAKEITNEMQDQANYAAVESAHEQKTLKKSKHAALMAKLEKKRMAKRKQIQKMKSQTKETIDGIQKSFEGKVQKQAEDSKHVMAHLQNDEKIEEGKNNDVSDNDSKWIELFDDESGRPYWWNKVQGSTWEKPSSISNHVFKSVQSDKCTTTKNEEHISTLMKKKSMTDEAFTLQWIDEHAVRTERLKNQELWEKALELEQELAHEREKINGADLQLVEHLEHYVNNSMMSVNETVENLVTNANTTEEEDAMTVSLTNGNAYEIVDNTGNNDGITTTTATNEHDGEEFTNIMNINTHNNDDNKPKRSNATENYHRQCCISSRSTWTRAGKSKIWRCNHQICAAWVPSSQNPNDSPCNGNLFH